MGRTPEPFRTSVTTGPGSGPKTTVERAGQEGRRGDRNRTRSTDGRGPRYPVEGAFSPETWTHEEPVSGGGATRPSGRCGSERRCAVCLGSLYPDRRFRPVLLVLPSPWTPKRGTLGPRPVGPGFPHHTCSTSWVGQRSPGFPLFPLGGVRGVGARGRRGLVLCLL